MSLRIRLTNLRLVDGALEADVESAGAPLPIPEPTPAPAPVPIPTPIPVLPAGYSADQNVAFQMLVTAMSAHGLTPTGVQNHGQQIVDALNETWPGLNVYRSPSDAPVWPGFGSIDVTIDSGRGGWSFRPDGVTRYER